jgi:hypothetical protein
MLVAHPSTALFPQLCSYPDFILETYLVALGQEIKMAVQNTIQNILIHQLPFMVSIIFFN